MRKENNTMEEARIREGYSYASEKVSASERIKERVMSMENNRVTHSGIGRLPKAVLIMSALAAVLLCSNLITYAVTGTGWIGRIMVAMNGSEPQEVVFTETLDVQGRTLYVGAVQDGPNGSTVTITTYDPAVLQGVSFRLEGDKLYVTDANGTEQQILQYDQNEGYNAGVSLVSPVPEK